jgi:hypothetical protein
MVSPYVKKYFQEFLLGGGQTRRDGLTNVTISDATRKVSAIIVMVRINSFIILK